ncbi:VanW family protein [Amycolatopsis suaedae]|uniref:VanW family protein n=1 Tax=Amycolatopsis suaedae TaxID=2510978 RepID=UPI001F0E8A40|nr:VanW family protein [Amycolatopsis suaedae]
MPQDRQWPESDAERTDVFPPARGELLDSSGPQFDAGATQHMPAVGQRFDAGATQQFDAAATQRFAPQRPDADAPTEQVEGVVPVPAPRAEDDDPGAARRRSLRKAAIIGGAALGVLVVVYGADLLISSGDVPRGVTVAGVDVGGMSRSDAEAELRQKLEPRLTQPVKYQAGDVAESFNPAEAGLKLDWPTTLDNAGDQPLNPFTRLASFFTTREVGVATHAEPQKLAGAMEDVRQAVDRDPMEGTIRFEEGQPIPVDPKQGQKLDVDGAMQAILTQWAGEQAVQLPVAVTPVRSTPEAVRAALEQFAKPAVSGLVLVRGEGKDAVLQPPQIGAALTFEVDEAGQLKPKIDNAKIVEAAGPQLASTEKEGKDAQIVFEGGRPTVQPSEDGKKINWDPSLAPLPEVLLRTENREVKALYENKPAKVTTEDANKYGVKEVIGEFTTKGFASDSGVNIRVVAQKVNGAFVKPGETFSLNGFTGPRTKAQGYVEAGVISDGAPGREVGGGISQFATTLYNAYYFAGMKDAGHKEHSYYISRYPVAREATVFQNHAGASVIDLKFTNDSDTGVAIQTIWSPSSITVKLWGTKRYNVESVTGERHNFTEPQEKAGPTENCQPSNGAQGFTASDTRILRDLSGREVRREPRNVRYNPQPKITCP